MDEEIRDLFFPRVMHTLVLLGRGICEEWAHAERVLGHLREDEAALKARHGVSRVEAVARCLQEYSAILREMTMALAPHCDVLVDRDDLEDIGARLGWVSEKMRAKAAKWEELEVVGRGMALRG